MSDVIYKYVLKIEDTQTIRMPVTARILSVQVQRDVPCIWAVVDLDVIGFEDRQFIVYGTGHLMTGDEGRFIGTFQMARGSLVFHLFESTHE